jgi:hypothetical protein
MADPSEYAFTPREVLEAMVKTLGIHEGRWMLGLGFGFAPGNFGPTPEQGGPGIAVIATQFLVQREPSPGAAPAGVVIDAAEVNPVPLESDRRVPRKALKKKPSSASTK